MRRRVRIVAQAFDPEAEISIFRRSLEAAGAIVTFTGQVRASSADGHVSSLHLQHYPGMTERGIDAILDEAAQRWPLEAALVIHRVGDMDPLDPIVLVATASAHRRAAFEATDFLMDYLKSRALFWKSQTNAAGRIWVEPRAEDYADARRWDDVPGGG